MAPNIKEISDALLSLDLSNHVLTAKYAPLTSEVASASAETASAEAQTTPNASLKLQQQHEVGSMESTEETNLTNLPEDAVDQDSYWDMPHQPELTADEKRQVVIDDILRQEEIRQMFTADHIVANLKRDAAAVAEHQSAAAAAKSESCSSDEVEGYWDMPTGDGDSESEAQEAAVESSTLEDKRANAVIPACLTTDHIVSNLISEGERLSSSSTSQDDMVVAPHVSDPTHPHYSYWDWDTSPQATNYEAKRRALIEQILEEERAREMTSAGHVLKTILESQGKVASDDNNDKVKDQDQAADDDTADSYWSFAPRSSDPVDTVRAPHTRDPNHPLADYWVWDTSPKSPDEQRQILIEWILREEAARQATCVEAVVEGLRQRAVVTGVGGPDAVEESKESAEGYWDW